MVGFDVGTEFCDPARNVEGGAVVVQSDEVEGIIFLAEGNHEVVEPVSSDEVGVKFPWCGGADFQTCVEEGWVEVDSVIDSDVV